MIRQPRNSAVSPSSSLEALDDPELMRAAAGGSSEAFGFLISRHQRILLNFFQRLGATSHEAEDAVQETFLRIHAYLDRYRPTASFRTFLFTVARRTWVDACRRTERRRRREMSGVDIEKLAARSSLSGVERLDLEEALSELPEGQRMVLILSIYGGVHYDEIARIMEIPEGTVKSRVFHALRKLRGRLAREHQV